MTGKIELVFEGEQEGTVKVSKALIGESVRQIFRQYFPDPLQKRSKKAENAEANVYSDIVRWFEQGNSIELSDDMSFKKYFAELKKVSCLESFVKKHVKTISNDYELATIMEFVLDGLHQNSKIAKDEADDSVSYKDMLGSILKERASQRGDRSSFDYEEEWNY